MTAIRRAYSCTRHTGEPVQDNASKSPVRVDAVVPERLSHVLLNSPASHQTAPCAGRGMRITPAQSKHRGNAATSGAFWLTELRSVAPILLARSTALTI